MSELKETSLQERPSADWFRVVVEELAEDQIHDFATLEEKMQSELTKEWDPKKA